MEGSVFQTLSSTPVRRMYKPNFGQVPYSTGESLIVELQSWTSGAGISHRPLEGHLLVPESLRRNPPGY